MNRLLICVAAWPMPCVSWAAPHGILQRQVGRPHHARDGLQANAICGTLPAAQQPQSPDGADSGPTCRPMRDRHFRPHCSVGSHPTTWNAPMPARTMRLALSPPTSRWPTKCFAKATCEVLAFLMSEAGRPAERQPRPRFATAKKWAGCPRSASTCAPSHPGHQRVSELTNQPGSATCSASTSIACR